MNTVYHLDGACLHDRSAGLAYLQTVLGFPAWYGKNLDALYDLLTELTDETAICVCNAAAADPAIVQTLADAAAENPSLTVTIASDNAD